MTGGLITIGMTSYNAAQTVEAAIRSALAQDWPRKEIIIYDDASLDGTPAVLESLQMAHPALHVIKGSENRGVAHARNQIIAAAKGDFIAFFDDDDTSRPERLSKQYRRLAAYEKTMAAPAFVLCHAARLQIYPDGARRIEPPPGTAEDGPAPCGRRVAERILFGLPLPGGFGSMATCSQMARREVYSAIGGFDESFRRSEDTDFNIRAALMGAHFIGIDEPLVHQTMTRAQEKNLEEERKMSLRLLEKYKDLEHIPFGYDFHKRWLEIKFLYLKNRKFEFLTSLITLFLTRPFCTSRKILWAMPNVSFLKITRSFHAKG